MFVIARFMILNPKIDVKKLVSENTSDNASLAKLLTDALNRSIRRYSTQLDEAARPTEASAEVTDICVRRRRVFDQHRDMIIVRVLILDEFPNDMRPIMVIPLFICDWINSWPAHMGGSLLRRSPGGEEAEPGPSADVTSGWRFITEMVEVVDLDSEE